MLFISYSSLFLTKNGYSFDAETHHAAKSRQHHQHDQHAAQLLALPSKVLEGIHASANESQDQRFPQSVEQSQTRAEK